MVVFALSNNSLARESHISLNSKLGDNSGSINFRGDYDYAQINDISGITDFTNTDAYTISFWVNIDSNQPNQQVSSNSMLEKWSGGSPAPGYPYAFRYYRTEKLIAATCYNGTDADGIAADVNPDTWVRVETIFDQHDEVRCG